MKIRTLIRKLFPHRHIWAWDEFPGGQDEGSCRCGAWFDRLARVSSNPVGHPKGRVS